MTVPVRHTDGPAHRRLLALAINKLLGYFTDPDFGRETLEAQKAENGFVDRDDSTISFVDGTRTFTIAPAVDEYVYYHDGELYTVTASDNIVITDVEGLHFIYYDGETLSETTTFVDELITVYALIAVIYWNATDNEAVYFGDERHGNVMDSQTHIYNHNTLSARYGEGLALGDIVADQNGDDDEDAQLSVANGEIWDEDIRFVIENGSPQTLSAIAQIPLFYRSGASGLWKKIAATNFPITTTGTGRAAWNEDTGATWQLTEVANNDFMLMHYYAAPDVNNPVIGIIGQATHATRNTAEEAAETELLDLQFGALGTLTPETVPIATVIFQTGDGKANTVKSSIESTIDGGDYIDWRFSRGGPSSAASGGAVEGTAVLSTGETGGTKFLREDGDNTCSWQAIAGGGDMLAANNLNDVASATTSRTNLGVDAAGTDNSTDVTLAGTGTYISIVGQVITVDPITESDISDLGSYAVIGGAYHDGFSDFVAEEHIDWTGDAGANNIHVNNITAVPEAAVTAHEGAIDHDQLTNFTSNEHFLQSAISITKSQVSDFTESDYATGAEGDLASSALQDKADVEGVLTGEISSHTHAGGGGAPTENVILTGTKTSGQNINGVEGTETDLTWDVVAQDTGELTSFSTGDSKIIFTNAGWLDIHCSAYVVNGVVNNRSMWGLALYHYNSGDTLQYSYHGDMQYNRDDAAAYDSSGGCVSRGMMKVAAGDYIYLRMRVFDDGTSGTAQTLDTSYSKIRIAQIAF